MILIIKVNKQTAEMIHSEGAALSGRSPLTVLADYLAARGLKHTRQRDVIVEIFFEMKGHVPIDEVVTRVRRRDPRIGPSTVYRTMKLLAECGLAVARHFGEGQTRYEAAADRDHHDHLICTSCNTIVEFENEEIEALQLRMARKHGFQLTGHKMELYGMCAACRTKGKA